MLPDLSRIVEFPVLLARSDIYRDLGSGFRGRRAQFDTSDVVIGLAIIAGLIVGFWLLAQLRARQERQGPYRSPRRLFSELCRAHRLDFKSRMLLRQLVRAHKLPQPSLVFVDERLFDLAALGQSWRGKAAAVTEIRRRIFSRGKPQTVATEAAAD